MANVYLNNSSTDFILEALRDGTFVVMEADRFVVNWNGARLEATGSGFLYRLGRLSTPEGGGSLVASLRLFDPFGVERIGFVGLSVPTFDVISLAAASSSGQFYDLLFAGEDLVRIGPDETFIYGGSGADTFFGDGRSNTYLLEDLADRIVEPANGGEHDVAVTEYGATGELLSFTLGAGRLAGIEFLSYEGDARVRVVGNGAANRVYAGDDNDTVSGGGGNDTLSGYDGDDSLSGGAGDDLLDGGAGRDTLLGGAGHDTIVTIGPGTRIDGGAGDDHVTINGFLAGDGADTVLGGAGNDTIFSGTSGNGRLLGGAGNDSISSFYELGANTLDGAAGNDTLDADGASDRLLGGAGDDLLSGIGLLDGGIGNDRITAGSGATVNAGAGDDIVQFSGAGITAHGGTGRDLFVIDGLTRTSNRILDFRRGEDRLDISDFIYNAGLGGQGFEDLVQSGALTFESSAGGLLLRLSAGGSTVEVTLAGVSEVSAADFVLGGDAATGTSGADVIRGTRFAVSIEGLAGNDWIELRVSNWNNTTSLLFASGGAGNDTIIGDGFGNALNPFLSGDAGNDFLVALTARHELQGGDGRDTLVAGGAGGSSTLAGGIGNDLYLLRSLGNQIVEAADGGIDTVGVSFDYTLGEHLEHLYQTDPHATNWQGTGNGLANRIAGGRAGSSRLFGDDGNDTLIGGSGRDTLDGGTGADRMIGGGGDDSYLVDHAGDRI
ncbi:MAG: hypothetical protein KIT81_12720, partial [Alphaproteobacteria bacterium]|nr:hypothetical protein [Alphaproteobacteria bacterium]